MAVYKPIVRGERSEAYYCKFQHEGKTYKRTTGCKLKVDAEEFEKKFRDSLKTAIKKKTKQRSSQSLHDDLQDYINDGKNIALCDAFPLMKKKPRKRQPGPTRWLSKEARWDDFCGFIQSKYPKIKHLRQVSKNVAEEYVHYITENGKFLRPSKEATKLAPSSINEYTMAITEVFTRLNEDAGLHVNPFIHIERMERKTQSRDIFTIQELNKINTALLKFRNNIPAAIKKLEFAKPMDFLIVEAIFYIGINSGLRRGDICTLEWKDVDFETNYITREQNKLQQESRNKRIVEIPMVVALSNYLKDRQAIRKDEEVFVFPEMAEMYLKNPTGISYRFSKFLKHLGIKTSVEVKGRSYAQTKKDIHSLRHSFAYLAGAVGIPFPVVQNILGHMTPELSALYMKHSTEEQKKQAVEMLGNSSLWKLTTADECAETDKKVVAVELLKACEDDDLIDNVIKQLQDSIKKNKPLALQ